MAISEKVKFPSGDGLRCAADLYLPGSEDYREKLPALVIGHGFSMVRSMLEQQAQCFCRAGYVVLALDYRGFGESEGEQGCLFPFNLVEDFRSAITYLENNTLVDPDRIGIWGTSFGGAIVTYTAAVDRRVKATVAQVPVTDGYVWMKLLRSEQHFVELLNAVDEDRKNRAAGRAGAWILAASKQGELCGIPGSDEFLSFFEQAKLLYPTWNPQIRLESIEKILQFSPLSVVDRISPRPYLIITGSGYDVVHPSWSVVDLYQRAREPKRLEFLPYEQLGLYFEPGLSEAADLAVTFFDEHLKRR